LLPSTPAAIAAQAGDCLSEPEKNWPIGILTWEFTA